MLVCGGGTPTAQNVGMQRFSGCIQTQTGQRRRRATEGGHRKNRKKWVELLCVCGKGVSSLYLDGTVVPEPADPAPNAFCVTAGAVNLGGRSGMGLKIALSPQGYFNKALKKKYQTLGNKKRVV